MAAHLDAIQARLDRIENQLNTVARRQADHIRTTAMRINRDTGTGPFATLQVIPFPDGTFPSELAQPLPPLNTVSAIRKLAAEDLQTYLENYCPDEPVPGPAAEKIKKLFKALGCTGPL